MNGFLGFPHSNETGDHACTQGLGSGLRHSGQRGDQDDEGRCPQSPWGRYALSFTCIKHFGWE